MSNVRVIYSRRLEMLMGQRAQKRIFFCWPLRIKVIKKSLRYLRLSVEYNIKVYFKAEHYLFGFFVKYF